MATLITGATGFVGQLLLDKWENVIVTSRNRERALSKLGSQVDDVVAWDPMKGPLDLDPNLPIDTIVHLMGEPVAEGRWNAAKKKRIEDSRITGTRNLIAGLQRLSQPPKVMVAASAVGIYGDQPGTVIDESNDSGTGFLADVCRRWESESMTLEQLGTRVACLRIGIVLGKNGGALKKLVPMFRKGLGGRLGNGKHYVPWIHVEDLVRLIHWCSDSDNLSGPVNATAPNPVTNQEFTQALSDAVGRPAWLPAPRLAVRLVFGEFANSLFSSQNVIPKAALESGFEFNFPQIDAALHSILANH